MFAGGVSRWKKGALAVSAGNDQHTRQNACNRAKKTVEHVAAVMLLHILGSHTATNAM